MNTDRADKRPLMNSNEKTMLTKRSFLLPNFLYDNIEMMNNPSANTIIIPLITKVNIILSSLTLYEQIFI